MAAYLNNLKVIVMQILIKLLIVLMLFGITFRILHSQEVSLEAYGFKIYMEDSQK